MVEVEAEEEAVGVVVVVVVVVLVVPEVRVVRVVLRRVLGASEAAQRLDCDAILADGGVALAAGIAMID